MSKDLVMQFLTALEGRDFDAAQAMFAPGAVMTFPTGATFTQVADLAAWSKGRYRKVWKSNHTFDEIPQGDITITYCRGFLQGEHLDGSPIKDVRFIDRFAFKDGKIIEQNVWNDLAVKKA